MGTGRYACKARAAAISPMVELAESTDPGVPHSNRGARFSMNAFTASLNSGPSN